MPSDRDLPHGERNGKSDRSEQEHYRGNLKSGYFKDIGAFGIDAMYRRPGCAGPDLRPGIGYSSLLAQFLAETLDQRRRVLIEHLGDRNLPGLRGALGEQFGRGGLDDLTE
ncbi:MAG: hypothetical protein ABSG16_23150, partial [Candidatus Acidiferrum sp.]